MPNHDPRKDPWVGDKLRDKNGQVVVVRPFAPGETRDLLVWRNTMKDAEILEVAKIWSM